MGFGGYGGNFPHIIFMVLNGLVALFLFLVVVGILFLLVRFLLHATTAAKIYVAKNSPAKSAPAAPAASSVAPPAPAAPPAPEARPASKPRTPKTPPPTA